jgi:hypothetical protein
MEENLKAMVADWPMLVAGLMQYQSLTTKAILSTGGGA